MTHIRRRVPVLCGAPLLSWNLWDCRLNNINIFLEQVSSIVKRGHAAEHTRPSSHQEHRQPITCVTENKARWCALCAPEPQLRYTYVARSSIFSVHTHACTTVNPGGTYQNTFAKLGGATSFSNVSSFVHVGKKSCHLHPPATLTVPPTDRWFYRQARPIYLLCVQYICHHHETYASRHTPISPP